MDNRSYIISYTNEKKGKPITNGITMVQDYGYLTKKQASFKQHSNLGDHEIGNTSFYHINEDVPKPEMLLNTSIALYGPTKSGKTTMVLNIIDALKPLLNFIYVVCPTNDLHHSYTPYIHQPYIYNDITPSLINGIIKRQESLMYFKTKYANNIEYIKKHIYEHIKDKLCEKKREIIDKTFNNHENISKELINKFISQFLKYLSQEHIDIVTSKATNEKEIEIVQKVIQYRGQMKTNSILILDDVSEALTTTLDSKKTATYNPVLAGLFTKSRHYDLTFIVLAHTATTIPTACRSNVMINIFCELSIFDKFFTATNNINAYDLLIGRLIARVYGKINHSEDRHGIAYLKSDNDRFIALRSSKMKDPVKFIKSSALDAYEKLYKESQAE